MTEQKVTWKWVGKNEFVPGCPARDLVEGEAERRGIEDIVEKSFLYQRVKKITAKKEGK